MVPLLLTRTHTHTPSSHTLTDMPEVIRHQDVPPKQQRTNPITRPITHPVHLENLLLLGGLVFSSHCPHESMAILSALFACYG